MAFIKIPGSDRYVNLDRVISVAPSGANVSFVLTDSQNASATLASEAAAAQYCADLAESAGLVTVD